MAMRRSFGAGGVKASKPVSFNSSGGGNSLLSMMMAQTLLPEKKAAETQAKMSEQQQAKEVLGPGAISTKSVGGNVTSVDPQMARVTTAESMNQLTRIRQIKKVVNGVENLAKTLPTNMLQAGYQTIGAKAFFGRGGTSKTRAYMSAVPAASAGVYRAVTGDNRLSDVDASERAKPLLWDTMEPEDVKEGKFAFLNFMLDEAERNLDPEMMSEPKDDTEAQIRWNAFVESSKEKFDALNKQNASVVGATKNDKIMMLAPGGRQIPVHPKQVQNALKRGLKMPQGV